MNRKVLVIFVALMGLAMLATPVLAIGPENAIGKNPNLGPPMPYGFDLIHEDKGLVIGWVTVTPISVHELYKDAGDFKINNAFVVTNPAQARGMENKWLFFSQSMLIEYFVLRGMPRPLAVALASHYPEGAYNLWNRVGQWR